VTTQHTHHEHSDADASVVKYPSAPENETTANSAASETASSEDVTAAAETQEPETSAAAVDLASEQETSTEAEPTSADATETNEVSSTSETSEDTSSNSASTEEQAESSNEAREEQSAAPGIEEPVSSTGGQSEAEETASSSAPEEHSASQEVTEPAASGPEATTESAPAASEEVKSETSTPDLVAEVQEEITRLEQEVQPADAVVTTETNVVAGEVPGNEEALPVPDTTFPYVEGSDLIDARAEEVRPFTDFIAEFRQAEAALQATLRDSQVEALTRLTTAAAEFANPEQQPQPEASESTEKSLTTEEKTADTPQAEAPVANEEQTEAVSEEKPAVVASEEEPKPVTRPVSPLLRPASRLRLPRHGSFGRHTREEVQQPVAEEKSASTANDEASTEAAPEAATPRPARRYRFDRPATASSAASGTTHTPARTTGTVHTTQTAAQRKAEEKLQRAEEAKANQQEQPASTVAAPEPQATSNKKHGGNNGVAQEAESSTATQPAEQHGRRRHSQKEQAASHEPVASHEPAAETSTPAAEQQASNQNKEEIAPEDLPPLEYSDLQKASSRRRRRHRSGSSSTATHANQHDSDAGEAHDAHVPPAPIPTPAPMPAPLTRTPAASSEGNNIYSIVSGHTVNQMNQGNDVAGPFMGPEPSPARGSVLSRDGRNTRAESRPTPTPSLYPSARSSEGGLSVAAMNQFANVVAQALQTQTDRMASEFRRISQAPTNVSVTLPPFPSTERVGVFVDVANLLYSARTLRIGVDFGKLLDFLRGNRRLVRAHAYCPTSPQPGDEQMFLQAVKGLGYRITTKNYKTFSSGAKKADLDLDLCMDVVRLVDGGAVDCIVLVSGDSDFMPMLDYCSDHGVRVEVAAFDEAMSATLRQSCDLFINLSMLEEIRA